MSTNYGTTKSFFSKASVVYYLLTLGVGGGIGAVLSTEVTHSVARASVSEEAARIVAANRSSQNGVGQGSSNQKGLGGQDGGIRHQDSERTKNEGQSGSPEQHTGPRGNKNPATKSKPVAKPSTKLAVKLQPKPVQPKPEHQSPGSKSPVKLWFNKYVEPWKQDRQKYASLISGGDLEFVLTMDNENGGWEAGTRSRGSYWCKRTKRNEWDWGFGVSKCWQEKYWTERPEFLTDWKEALRLSYDLYKGGTPFYGKSKNHKNRPKFIFELSK